MEQKRTCPKCKIVCRFINHGKTKLKNGKSIQRLKCVRCGRTLQNPHRHRFFDGMHTESDVFDKAMRLFSEEYTITTISKELHIRPNTIIDWVHKVRTKKSDYISYLRGYPHHFSSMDIQEFFVHSSKVGIRKRMKHLKQFKREPCIQT